MLIRLGDPPAPPGRQQKFDIFGSALRPFLLDLKSRPRPRARGRGRFRLRSGPFEGPATVKPPALPVDTLQIMKRVLMLLAIAAVLTIPLKPQEASMSEAAGLEAMTAHFL